MPNKDPDKRREYQLNYSRTDARKAQMKIWTASQAGKNSKQNYYHKNRAFRKGLLSDFTCCSCENSDPSVIQWHHLEPEDKTFDIFSCIGKPHDVWWNEVLKCVPLCANCHVKLHKEQLCLIPRTSLTV